MAFGKKDVAADRGIIYSIMSEALKEAERHIGYARSLMSDPQTSSCKAAEHCLQAADALVEVEDTIAASGKVVTTRKRNNLERDIKNLRQRLWQTAIIIRRKAPVKLRDADQLCRLRQSFVAYAWDAKPADKAAEA